MQLLCFLPQMITDYAAWPTLSLSQLENNCVLYQKVKDLLRGDVE